MDKVTLASKFAAFSDHWSPKIVGELNGRWSTRSGEAFPGTETRGLLKLGGRFTQGSVRFDAGVFFGLTSIDPTFGFTGGVTYVFNAFTVP